MSESSPTNPRRGDLLALTSAIFAAVFLLAFRAANAEAPRAAAVLAMLGWSTLFNAGVALVRARGGRAGWPRRVTVRAAAVLAVLTILGNVGVAGALGFAAELGALMSGFREQNSQCRENKRKNRKM